MQLTPTEFRFMGNWEFYEESLDSGEWQQGSEIKEVSEIHPHLHPVKTAEIWGRKVIILNDPAPDAQPSGFLKSLNDGAVFKSLQHRHVNTSHKWDDLAINKLVEIIEQKEGKPVLLVEPWFFGNKIGDIEYQQRLNSFFIDGNPDNKKHVHPTFADIRRFNPETLANHGWKHEKPMFENEESAKNSWLFRECLKSAPEEASALLRGLQAKDVIVPCFCNEDGYQILSGFDHNESFPDGLDTGNSEKNAEISAVIKASKATYDNHIFMQNGVPCEAKIMKLVGSEAYLLMPTENMEEFQCDEVPDSQLFHCYMQTWSKCIQNQGQKKFEIETLPTLRRILPEINGDLIAINNVIKQLCQLSSSNNDDNDRDFNASIHTLTDKIKEFQSLYQELIICQYRKEFLQVTANKAQYNLEHLPQRQVLSIKVNFADLSLKTMSPEASKADLEACYRAAKIKAEDGLKDLEIEIKDIRAKMTGQSDLKKRLDDFLGRVNSKFSDSSSEENSLSNGKEIILSLIHEHSSLDLAMEQGGSFSCTIM